MSAIKLYGLIGYPLGHSFSKRYFTRKFLQENLQDYQYDNFPIAHIDEFMLLLENHSTLRGLNVTIPYKEKIIPYLHAQSETVRQIGACNCIKIENGQLTGHNTDVPAFLQSIKKMLQPHHQQALVLGTGGAAKAINFALDELRINRLTVTRNKQLHGVIHYSDINAQLLQDYSIIINTTPVGTFPDIDQCPDIPYQYLGSQHLLFDLVYNPEMSLFLQKGKERGAATRNGYEMLELQADKSWEIWQAH